MKKSELRQIIREEIEKNEESSLKQKLKKALEKLKDREIFTKQDILYFIEAFFENIDN